MIHPTCSSVEDGPCPYTPLAGVETCLRHTERGARVQLGGLDGHDQCPAPHPDPSDVAGIESIPAARPARAYTPPPVAPAGWLARAVQWVLS
ncbi:hypothetical protein ACWEOE_10795 [Amycolatopsis sp. NPDC004368]